MYSIIEFITIMEDKEKYERLLATIMCADIVDSQSLLFKYGEEYWAQIIDKFHSLSEQLIQQYQGAIVEKISGGTMIIFESLSDAVHCGLDFQEQIKAYNIPIKIAVHTGECIKMQDSISGLAVHIVKYVHQNASSQNILITQTVKNLLFESDFKTEFMGEISLTGVKHPVKLYSIKYDLRLSLPFLENIGVQKTSQNTSFLEEVINCIKNHLKNPEFRIETLCSELVISERQLQRKLKLITNKSPTQIIRSVRLHRAKDLILLQGMSISDSAYETGFNSPSYFTKCFKIEFGKLPSEIMD